MAESSRAGPISSECRRAPLCRAPPTHAAPRGRGRAAKKPVHRGEHLAVSAPGGSSPSDWTRAPMRRETRVATSTAKSEGEPGKCFSLSFHAPHRSEPQQHRCHSSPYPVEHDLKRLRATSARSLSTLESGPRLVHPLRRPSSRRRRTVQPEPRRRGAVGDLATAVNAAGRYPQRWRTCATGSAGGD